MNRLRAAKATLAALPRAPPERGMQGFEGGAGSPSPDPKVRALLRRLLCSTLTMSCSRVVSLAAPAPQLRPTVARLDPVPIMLSSRDACIFSTHDRSAAPCIGSWTKCRRLRPELSACLPLLTDNG